MGAKKWRSVGYVKHTRRFLAVVLHWSVSLSHEHSMRHFFPLHYSSDSNRKNKQQKRWKERKKGHDFTLNAPPSNMLVEARTPSCSTNQLQQLKQKREKRRGIEKTIIKHTSAVLQTGTPFLSYDSQFALAFFLFFFLLPISCHQSSIGCQSTEGGFSTIQRGTSWLTQLAPKTGTHMHADDLPD